MKKLRSWGLDGLTRLPRKDGVIDVEQMEDNLSYMRGFHGLTPEQEQTIEQAREALNKVPLIPCTTCNYCEEVCPQHISIRESLQKVAKELL